MSTTRSPDGRHKGSPWVPLAGLLFVGLAATSAVPIAAQAAEPPKTQTASAGPPEDIVVTARRRTLPDLQQTQEFNAEELARLRQQFEPPPPREPRSFEGDSGTTAAMTRPSSTTSRTRRMIDESPHVGGLILGQ